MTSAPPLASTGRLTALVRGIARESRWRELVRFDVADRVFVRLADAGDHEAWLLTWLPGQRTGLHGHDGSAGAFLVVRGCLRESAVPARRRGPLAERVVRCGQVRAFGPRHVHDVANTGEQPAVSLHVYAPKLVTMTRYAATERGLVALGVDRVGVDW